MQVFVQVRAHGTEHAGGVVHDARNDVVVGPRNHDLVGLGKVHDALGHVDAVTDHADTLVGVMHHAHRPQMQPDAYRRHLAIFLQQQPAHSSSADCSASSGSPRKQTATPSPVSITMREDSATPLSALPISSLKRSLSAMCWSTGCLAEATRFRNITMPSTFLRGVPALLSSCGLGTRSMGRSSAWPATAVLPMSTAPGMASSCTDATRGWGGFSVASWPQNRPGTRLPAPAPD